METPARRPLSLSAWATQRRNVSRLIPSCGPTASAVAVTEPYSGQVVTDHPDRPGLDLRVKLLGHEPSVLSGRLHAWGRQQEVARDDQYSPRHYREGAGQRRTRNGGTGRSALPSTAHRYAYETEQRDGRSLRLRNYLEGLDRARCESATRAVSRSRQLDTGAPDWADWSLLPGEPLPAALDRTAAGTVRSAGLVRVVVPGRHGDLVADLAVATLAISSPPPRLRTIS
jgi:hypothetical protein